MHAGNRGILVSPARAKAIVDSLLVEPSSGAEFKTLMGFPISQSLYLPDRYGVIEIQVNSTASYPIWPMMTAVGVIDFGDA
jgi:hypothetical protein